MACLCVQFIEPVSDLITEYLTCAEERMGNDLVSMLITSLSFFSSCTTTDLGHIGSTFKLCLAKFSKKVNNEIFFLPLRKHLFSSTLSVNFFFFV